MKTRNFEGDQETFRRITCDLEDLKRSLNFAWKNYADCAMNDEKNIFELNLIKKECEKRKGNNACLIIFLVIVCLGSNLVWMLSR